jgi:xylulokinase
MADVLGAELVTVNTTEGAAYGAALLAAVGGGLFDSVEQACDKCIKITGRTEPGENRQLYERLYPLYQELYPSLKQEFVNIDKFVSG